MKLGKQDFSLRFFVPRYNELALFLMSLSFVLLFITNAELRTRAGEELFGHFDPRRYVAAVFFVLGIVYSLYHVFTERRKTDWEKTTMLFFAVLVNGLCGIVAGMYMLVESKGPMMVFPIWNIANGAMLLILYRLKVVDTGSIADDNATLPQVAIGAVAVATTFGICNYVFSMHWAITFSICVAYSCNLNEVIQCFLLGTRFPNDNSG